jgi:uncharacterized protein YqgV (UPF0045/DUF77 family)
MSDGEVRPIEIPAGIDVETAIANAEKKLENANLAEAIKGAFTDIEVNVAPAEAGLAAITSGVNEAIEKADAEANSKLSNSSS